MASAAGKMTRLSVLVPMLAPVVIGSAGYAAWRLNWETALRSFFTGPGRSSRIALLLFIIFNWKNMPLAWTVSISSTF
jgi:hypothetical protein